MVLLTILLGVLSQQYVLPLRHELVLPVQYPIGVETREDMFLLQYVLTPCSGSMLVMQDANALNLLEHIV